MEETKIIRRSRPAVREVRQAGDMTEIITSTEAINPPSPMTEPAETPDQRMDRLTKELHAWCDTNNVAIVVVAVGKKSNQIAPAIDWQPDTHVFVHALAPRQQ